MNEDAITTLSDQVMKLMVELQELKNSKDETSLIIPFINYLQAEIK